MSDKKPVEPDPRKRVYAEIVVIAKEGLARYYGEYPEHLDDARAREALAWSLRGVTRILRALDKVEIRDLPRTPPQRKDEP